MVMYPDAFNLDMLEDIFEANDAAPSIDEAEMERLIEVAQEVSGADSTLDADNEWCLIGTEWQSFCKNTFGDDDGLVNRFAIGVHEADISSGKGATLFSKTRIIQHQWLKGGDGRRQKYCRYVDDDYEDANAGDMWVPRGAQEYMLIVELKPELLHGQATIAEAM